MSSEKTEVAKLFQTFEDCRFEHDGVEAWRARDLMLLLGYPRWREFRPAIVRAWNSCKSIDIDPERNFIAHADLAPWDPEEKVFGVDPKNPGGGRPSEDVILTRRAAYLVAMNGDPRKPEVAFAQHYFAAATRTLQKLQQRMLEAERIEARGELKETEARFQSVLFEHGVDGDGIKTIRSCGDQALFGGRDTRAMKQRYGIPSKSTTPLADHAPEIVIRAKQLSSAMTTHNVQTHELHGESAIRTEHVENNRSVREMVKSRGIILEDVPPEEDIKKVERRHALEVKKLQKPDKPKAKKTTKGEPSQSQKFIEAARELECDDDEEAFRERFKKLTETPPPASVEKRKRGTKI
jgi:DNA-damage-inducible protein D